MDVVISNCVINLSPAKPRVLAEAFRVLRPGGRLGVSDVIADEGLDPAQRAEAERQNGCTIGTLTAAEYQRLLLAAGFTGITITTTSDAGPGLHSAIVQATRPAAPPEFSPGPCRQPTPIRFSPSTRLAWILADQPRPDHRYRAPIATTRMPTRRRIKTSGMRDWIRAPV